MCARKRNTSSTGALRWLILLVGSKKDSIREDVLYHWDRLAAKPYPPLPSPGLRSLKFKTEIVSANCRQKDLLHTVQSRNRSSQLPSEGLTQYSSKPKLFKPSAVRRTYSIQFKAEIVQANCRQKDLLNIVQSRNRSSQLPSERLTPYSSKPKSFKPTAVRRTYSIQFKAEIVQANCRQKDLHHTVQSRIRSSQLPSERLTPYSSKPKSFKPTAFRRTYSIQFKAEIVQANCPQKDLLNTVQSRNRSSQLPSERLTPYSSKPKSFKPTAVRKTYSIQFKAEIVQANCRHRDLITQQIRLPQFDLFVTNAART
ncbi:hypothetical protein BaRGS_00007604 [Batillaria attramentaria]|uniref:Uncharacterized protein n=1 Tax=Batillaria attramentaria TaxID=370345 RepID=A0ABD0LNS2_9CAEN